MWSQLLLMLLVSAARLPAHLCSMSVRVSNLLIGATAHNLINSDIEDIYRIVYNSSLTTLKVTAWINGSTPELPLLIVIRQEEGLVSLQLPIKETYKNIRNVSRILCPSYARRDASGMSTVYIDVYTSSIANISYSLHISYFQSFVLKEMSSISVLVSPFDPVFFKYDMATESSLVRFRSEDKICTTVSVQRMLCPVFDLTHTVDFAGQYQTMTQLSSISVDNADFQFKSMYVVVSVHPNDNDCCDIANCSYSSHNRVKNVTIELLPGYDNSTINLNYAITLSFFLAIYILIFPFLCFVEPYSEKNLRMLINDYKLDSTSHGSTSLTAATSDLNSRIAAFSMASSTLDKKPAPSLSRCVNGVMSSGGANGHSKATTTNNSNSSNNRNSSSSSSRSAQDSSASEPFLSAAARFSNTNRMIRESLFKIVMKNNLKAAAAAAAVTATTTTTNNISISKAAATTINDKCATAPSVDTTAVAAAAAERREPPSPSPTTPLFEEHQLQQQQQQSSKAGFNLGAVDDDDEKPHDSDNSNHHHEHLTSSPSLHNATGLLTVCLNDKSPTQPQASTPAITPMSALHIDESYGNYAITNAMLALNENNNNSFSSFDYEMSRGSGSGICANEAAASHYKASVRSKPNLKVHDLARKHPKLLDRKIMNYPRLIIAIATFYVLPVIQLIILYQTQLTKSGNEDACYFNFLCMIKSGHFAAFNNVFSNVGYVLLGIMFIIVVKKRSYSYTYMRKKYPFIMATHGVPQHFGLFYTMGIGLIMEGVLSAAYHVCPSYNNFQFDTSFMYIIGVISTIKLYQCRHPDIHPSSQKVFLFLALCILVNVVGVFYGKTYTWFVLSYSIFHVVFFFSLSLIVYNMKQPKFGLSSLKELAKSVRNIAFKLPTPTHFDRLIMLGIANVFNIGLAVYAILVPTQFSAHLLNVLLGNFMLYFMMYIINKIMHNEKFHIITVINLVLSTIAWIAALYFFKIEIKQWDKKPAESREANRECILLKVYDHHDAWHFLSALSMFMSFVVLLTLDDGIITKKRGEIAVF